MVILSWEHFEPSNKNKVQRQKMRHEMWLSLAEKFCFSFEDELFEASYLTLFMFWKYWCENVREINLFAISQTEADMAKEVIAFHKESERSRPNTVSALFLPNYICCCCKRLYSWSSISYLFLPSLHKNCFKKLYLLLNLKLTTN